MLRDYTKEDRYYDSGDCAASGIIGRLEFADSDSPKGIAEIMTR